MTGMSVEVVINMLGQIVDAGIYRQLIHTEEGVKVVIAFRRLVLAIVRLGALFHRFNQHLTTLG